MDFLLNVVSAIENEAGLGRRLAFLKALAPDFVMRSSAVRSARVSPSVTEKELLEPLKDYEELTRDVSRKAVSLILKKGGGHFIIFEMTRGEVKWIVLSSDEKAMETSKVILSTARKYPFVNKEEDGVWAEFSHGGLSISRTTEFLNCAPWGTIAENYPVKVRQQIAQSMAVKEPWSRGRLMIWQGAPGTGKTWALRALMMAWRERFDFMVVTDPERFAQDPEYYFTVASKSGAFPWGAKSAVGNLHNDDDEEESKTEKESLRKRKLFILEDAADLVIVESRAKHYDKIGKLLNMTDGLFGQGRQDMFLITFNEKVDGVDEAFLRPGRCASRIEFEKFSKQDANAWLESHHVDYVAKEEVTLAELYAKLHESKAPVRTK